MPVVGEKDVFAIEWEIFPNLHEVGFRYVGMKFRYWGNSIPIGIWEDNAHVEPVIRYTERFLQEPNIRFYIDFSSLGKEHVYRCIHESYIENEYPEEYHYIYLACRKKLLERISLEKTLTHEQRSAYSQQQFLIDDVEDYLLYRSMRTDDVLLANWLSHNFSIEDLGEDCFNHQSIYLVRDIAKNQERLIWRYFDISLYEKLTKQCINMPLDYKTRVHEAVLPIDYFTMVAHEFVHNAKAELEAYRNGMPVPAIDEANWRRQ